MILLDVNVVMYAVRREFPQHDEAHQWLSGALVGEEPVAVTDEVLAAVVRLVTHHRVLARPASPHGALAICRAVRSAPAAVTPMPSARRWSLLERWVSTLDLRGNDLPDALLAATAQDLGARLATFDRGFRRFAGLPLIMLGDTGS